MADNKNIYDLPTSETAWCPGCGNHGILKIVKSALIELDIKQDNFVMVSGIGQAAKSPQYLNANFYNGLHGRAIPPATAIKASNPRLTVIVESGDGDIYGEGGNHFIHAIRRNPDITVIVHDNMVYGLTKGQASPTSQLGFKTPVQTNGVFEEPFNPLAVAVALDISFAARANAADAQQTKEIIKKAILHKGFSLVDVFQSCVTFNKINTYQWFKDNTYYLENTYNPFDRQEAFKRATETGKYPLGVLYTSKDKKTFDENLSVYRENSEPLWSRDNGRANRVLKILESMK